MLPTHTEKPSGYSAAVLKTWGYLFLLIGIAGQSIIQNKLLGLGSLSTVQLFEAMNADENVMIYATLALVCHAVSTCATPIFAFLLVEGFQHTTDVKNYLTRVTIMALASEIPYNMAMSGQLLDFSSRNPALGLVLSLIVLLLFRKFEEKTTTNTLMKVVFVFAGIIWAKMLSISDANAMVVMTVAFWLVRNRAQFRSMVGCGAAGLCTMFSVYYLAAPMSVLTIHAYNGEKGSQNRVFSYLFYPLALLTCGLAVLFL